MFKQQPVSKLNFLARDTKKVVDLCAKVFFKNLKTPYSSISITYI